MSFVPFRTSLLTIPRRSLCLALCNQLQGQQRTHLVWQWLSVNLFLPSYVFVNPAKYRLALHGPDVVRQSQVLLRVTSLYLTSVLFHLASKWLRQIWGQYRVSVLMATPNNHSSMDPFCTYRPEHDAEKAKWSYLPSRFVFSLSIVVCTREREWTIRNSLLTARTHLSRRFQ